MTEDNVPFQSEAAEKTAATPDALPSYLSICRSEPEVKKHSDAVFPCILYSLVAKEAFTKFTALPIRRLALKGGKTSSIVTVPQQKQIVKK